MFRSKGIGANTRAIQEAPPTPPPPALFTLVQTMGAVCAFDQGGDVGDNEKSAAVPRVLEPSLQSTRSLFQHPLSLLPSSLRRLDLLLVAGNANKAQK